MHLLSKVGPDIKLEIQEIVNFKKTNDAAYERHCPASFSP